MHASIDDIGWTLMVENCITLAVDLLFTSKASAADKDNYAIQAQMDPGLRLIMVKLGHGPVY